MLSGIETVQLAILAALGIYASYIDIRFRKLPNVLSLLTLVFGLVISFALGGADGVVSGLLHAVIALLIGMLLFAAGVIGGGDAKFYAGVAAWFSLQEGLFLFSAVALSGLALLLVWVMTRWLARRRIAKAGAGEAFDKLPYGVAISLGGVVSAAMIALRS